MNGSQKIIRTSPNGKFKHFSLTYQKPVGYECIGKTNCKKNQTENRGENQRRNVACEQKSSSEKGKFDSHKN